MSALTPKDLGAMPLFAELVEEQHILLLDRHRETSHQVDQVIVMEQDWGESLFLIRDGLAKVRTYTADGDEVIMSLLGPGDVFGEMAALDGASRSADVVALTPLHLIKLRSAPFASLLRKQASFALALARLEASRLLDLNQRFALQSADATTRLLDALATLPAKVHVIRILKRRSHRLRNERLPCSLDWREKRHPEPSASFAIVAPSLKIKGSCESQMCSR